MVSLVSHTQRSTAKSNLTSGPNSGVHFSCLKNRLRVRVRYLDEAINDNTYLERSLAALGDYAMRVRSRDTLRVRLDTKFWLDKRMATTLRTPSPEVSLWLFYEARL